MDFHLRANKNLLAPEGCVLYLKTSEELPSATYVYRVLMCMAERGLLQRFAAVLVARPKAWDFERPNTTEERARFRNEQEEAIREVLREYHPRALAVFDLDFGHTDPQCVIRTADGSGSTASKRGSTLPTSATAHSSGRRCTRASRGR